VTAKKTGLLLLGDVLKPVENWSGGIPRPIR